MSVLAQARVAGEIFRRKIENLSGPDPIPKGENVVSIVAALSDATGMVKFLLGTESPVPPADLQTIAFDSAEELYDHSIVIRALETTRKQTGGASHLTTDTNRLIRDRGGDPDFRAPKPKSSFLLKEGKRIKKREREIFQNN